MLVAALNSILGVELKFLEDQRMSCRFALVSRQGNKVDIEQVKQLDGNLVEVLQGLPKKYPMALSLTGKGLLHKNVQIVGNGGAKALFEQAFPAVDRQEFYVQEFVGETNALVSIIRKQLVDELLERMRRAGLTILSLSLGAMASSAIWSQLNSYGQEIQFDGHFFRLDENKDFIAYQHDAVFQSQFPLKVGEMPLDQQQVVAYGSAFQLLLYHQLLLVRADVEQVNADLDNHISNHSLKKKAVYFVCSLFVTLLLSFLLFAYYNDRNTQLLSSQGARTADADQIGLMQKSILERETILKRLNWNGGYNYGFLLNEIGASLPTQLQLTELSCNDYKSDKEQQERIPQIRILGTSSDPVRVNNWIFELKKKQWIKSVTLIRYQEDMQGGQYQFTLMITY